MEFLFVCPLLTVRIFQLPVLIKYCSKRIPQKSKVCIGNTVSNICNLFFFSFFMTMEKNVLSSFQYIRAFYVLQTPPESHSKMYYIAA